MVYKALLGVCSLVFSLLCFAEQPSSKLTQEQYNQRIQQYTTQVNATKLILDEENVKIDATEQHKVFCSRIDAYQGIAKLSQENIELETANMMLMIAENFLGRQRQSIEQSGMTLDVFCAKRAKK